MVKIVFARNAKVIEVLEDKYKKANAQKIAYANRSSAFGIIHGIMKAFKKKEKPIVLMSYRKRYYPFWHVMGESVQEYKRQTTYGFPVKPEIISITFNKKTIPVDKDETHCHFDATDHCFEHYSKEIIKSAIQEQEKIIPAYLGANRKKIKSVSRIQNKDTVVLPISMRASFLVNNLIKDLIKPIQADDIIKEVVEIKHLALVLRPAHVFEFKEEGTGQVKTIEVNAITGIWKKGEQLISKALRKELISEGIFEVSTELASTVIPGAALAATIGKHIKRHRTHKKELKQSKAWRNEYTTRKKKK